MNKLAKARRGFYAALDELESEVVEAFYRVSGEDLDVEFAHVPRILDVLKVPRVYRRVAAKDVVVEGTTVVDIDRLTRVLGPMLKMRDRHEYVQGVWRDVVGESDTLTVKDLGELLQANGMDPRSALTMARSVGGERGIGLYEFAVVLGSLGELG